jgi:hypothetical protein
MQDLNMCAGTVLLLVSGGNRCAELKKHLLGKEKLHEKKDELGR